MNLFISVTGIAQCPDRNYRSVFLKIVQRKNFQIQQLDFIIDQRLRISDLLIGQLGLKLTDLHTGEVSFTISGQVQVIRQLRVPDILFGNGNLCAEIFEPAPHLTDIQLDVELFCAVRCAFTRAFFSPQSKIGTVKLMATRGFCVGLS